MPSSATAIERKKPGSQAVYYRRLVVLVSPDQRRAVEDLSYSMGLNMSEFVRSLVDGAIKTPDNDGRRNR